MDLKDRYKAGMTADDFLGTFNSDQKQLHATHAKRADVERFRNELIGKLPPLRILIITEPWCGDSAAIVPVLLKLMEGMEEVKIRFLPRDRNLDLMDRYLTRGARAIPKIIIMDGDYRELAVWGPRPRAAQEIFENHRSRIESGEIEKIEVIKKIRAFYSKDRGRAIAAELTALLHDAVRRSPRALVRRIRADDEWQPNRRPIR